MPVDLMSLWLSHELPSRILLGSWFNCTFPRGSGFCCHVPASQWPEEPIVQTLLLQPGLSLLAFWATLYQTKQARHKKAARLYQSLALSTTERYKWKNFCCKQPGLLFNLFLFLYIIHLSITWNFHWNQQALWYIFSAWK